MAEGVASFTKGTGIDLGSGDWAKYLTGIQFLLDHWQLLVVAAVALALTQLFALLRRKPAAPAAVFLDPQEFKPATLASKTHITHNTVLLRFDLPDPGLRLGLPTGQHITFKASDVSAAADGSSPSPDIFRPYTPTSDDDLRGAVEFVIKLYPQGKMSQVVAAMEVGEEMLMKGPRGKFQYKQNMRRHIGGWAAGQAAGGRCILGASCCVCCVAWQDMQLSATGGGGAVWAEVGGRASSCGGSSRCACCDGCKPSTSAQLGTVGDGPTAGHRVRRP